MKIELTGKKTKEIRKLIFSILDILVQIGIPLSGKTDRRLERMAEVCLAVGKIQTTFSEATSSDCGIFSKTRDLISFMNQHYGENISSGSYDDIRRKDLVLLVEAGIVLNSSFIDKQATNNPMRGYALSPHFVHLLKVYDTSLWKKELKSFQLENRRLQDELAQKKNLERIPVTLPSGKEVILSPGEHNELQKSIIESFLPIFGFSAQVLYVGDTANKFLFRAEEELKQLGVFTLGHEELPDIIAYSTNKKLLFLIEAVHSVGPMSEIRIRKLKRQLKECHANTVFITAFLTKKDFKKWVMDIAWETEVWIAENPEHLIHFNGYKFLEIHK